MEKSFATCFAGILALLSITGFIPMRDGRHIAGMNADREFSYLRIPFTLALLYAGSSTASLKQARYVLAAVGATYLLIGVTGMADKRLGRTLPSGLTGLDTFVHLTTGMTALWLGTRSGRMMKP